MVLAWLHAYLATPRRHRIKIEILPVSKGGKLFETDARYDLFVDGERAGYSLTPNQVKNQIEEKMDIDMRALAGFDPPSR